MGSPELRRPATDGPAVPRFEYPCPDCRSINSLHESDCRFEGVPWGRIEDAYLDTVAPLATGVRSEAELEAAWETASEGDPAAAPGPGPGPGPGGRREPTADVDPVALRRAALARLRREGRVDERNGRLRLRTAEEYREEATEPSREPLRTIYRHGSVPGCHDNAVFAMIAWYEMVDLSWPETKDNVVTWLRESGAWDRGGFEESSPEKLVESKRHVYESGYGWKQAGQEAKAVIDRHLG